MTRPTAAVQLSQGGARHELTGLTRREQEVLAHMAQGLSNTGIGRRMFLSPKTVETHIGAIFTKLGLLPEDSENRRVAAVLIWLTTTPGRDKREGY